MRGDRISKSESTPNSNHDTYMCEIPHDLHLVVDLLIQDPILHEPPLVQLLCSIDCTMLLRRQLVHRGKGTLPDLPSHIVHGTTRPVHAIGICDRP